MAENKTAVNDDQHRCVKDATPAFLWLLEESESKTPPPSQGSCESRNYFWTSIRGKLAATTIAVYERNVWRLCELGSTLSLCVL